MRVSLCIPAFLALMVNGNPVPEVSAVSVGPTSVLVPLDSASSTVSSLAADPSSSFTQSGAKRYVAYWSIWAESALRPTATQLKGVTHLILSFVDMTTGVPVWAAGRSQFILTDIQAIQAIGIKFMAAVGGWNLDNSFRPAAATSNARIAFAQAVIGFAKQWNLDGVDLDWEYPVWNGQNYKLPESDPNSRIYNEDDAPNFVELAKEFRRQLDAYAAGAGRTMELSIAVPSRHEDMIAYNMTGIVKGLDASLDWWNLMTYDFLNRRDAVTRHQAGGVVIADNLAIYQGVYGLNPKKLNIGFPMYSKWFKIKSGCMSTPPIGCEMGYKYEDDLGQDTGLSGWVTFNPNTTDNQAMVTAWSHVNADSYRDQTALASAHVQGDYFWTWLSAADVEESCDKYLDQVGGVFIWSINQDNRGADGGDHIDKIAACVASAH